MSDRPPDAVIFTIGGKEFPVHLVSFADAKRHNIVGPPALLDQIERVFAMVAALMHTEEKPISAAFLMEGASLGEALDLLKSWAELMRRSGVPSPPSMPIASPISMPTQLSMTVPEQPVGFGPNFPDPKSS